MTIIHSRIDDLQVIISWNYDNERRIRKVYTDCCLCTEIPFYSNPDKGKHWAILGTTPWIIDEVEDKIQSNLGNSQIHNLYIAVLQAESWVVNQFFDLLLSQNFAEQGLRKLKLVHFKPKCEPFEDEIMSRLASKCPNIKDL